VKRVVFHRLAAKELVRSAVSYEAARPLLGDRFLDAVDFALVMAQRHPALGFLGKVGTRSHRVRRFPYRLIYLEQPDRLWIVAVAHQSRRPDYRSRRVVTK
jgi:mRNA-degrading endonuclease RelE of RelBE toxin-antitoxin system